MCGVSDDRCIGFRSVRWLFGGSMVGLLVVLFVPLVLSFFMMPGTCCFLHVTHMHGIYARHICKKCMPYMHCICAWRTCMASHQAQAWQRKLVNFAMPWTTDLPTGADAAENLRLR